MAPPGFGGYGFGGYGGYGGYYDPWYGGDPMYGGSDPQSSYKADADEGSLRLKIKPREHAENAAAQARAERVYEELLGSKRELVGRWIAELNFSNWPPSPRSQTVNQ